MNRRDQGYRDTLLFISHEASGSGAPRVLLNIVSWFRTHTDFGLRVILRVGGALEPEFRAVAEVFFESDWSDALLRDVCLIYSNTGTNGLYIRNHATLGIPVVTHLHELQQALRWSGPDNTSAVLSQSEHFIACSSGVRRMLVDDCLVDPGAVSLIPECIVPGDVRNRAAARAGAEVREEWGIGPDEFLVVGCGNTEVRKGTDLFILMAHACQRRNAGRVKFLWVGPVGADLANGYYLQDIEKLGLGESVRLLGQVDNPHPILAACDLFCLPSREDPFPLVMLEAGALGKPTLAFSGSGGAEEYCGKGGGFLVPYLDVAAMSDRILSLVERREELEAVGAGARRLVEEEFAVDTVGPAIDAVVRRVAVDGQSLLSGTAQIYLPCAEGYSESNSILRTVRAHEWNRLQFRFSAAGEGAPWRVRFDPLDQPAVIEIASIRLKSRSSGKVVWAGEDAAGLATVTAEGTAVRVQDANSFRVVTLGADAMLYLPELRLPAGRDDYQLDVEMRADRDVYELGRTSDPVIQAYREQSGLKRELERTRDALAVAEKAHERIRALLHAIARCRGRDLYIWGTGAAGREIAGLLQSCEVPFTAFVDRDPGKIGPELLGHPVISAAAALETRGDSFIFIGSQFYREIGAGLASRGFVSGEDYETPGWLR